jgi:DNA-binding Lrp family transcriptional regulator
MRRRSGKIDEIDHIILAEKERDPFRTAQEIAPVVGLSHVSVQTRYNRLRDLGVIEIKAIVHRNRITA